MLTAPNRSLMAGDLFHFSQPTSGRAGVSHQNGVSSCVDSCGILAYCSIGGNRLQSCAYRSHVVPKMVVRDIIRPPFSWLVPDKCCLCCRYTSIFTAYLAVVAVIAFVVYGSMTFFLTKSNEHLDADSVHAGIHPSMSYVPAWQLSDGRWCRCADLRKQTFDPLVCLPTLCTVLPISSPKSGKPLCGSKLRWWC